MSWLIFALRRFLLPALVAGVVATLILYWVLETEGGYTDWMSMAMLAGIALACFVVCAPLFWLLYRARLPLIVNIAAVLVMGVVAGALGMALIVVYWVEASDAFGFNHLGIPAGVAAAVTWIFFNFDLLRAGGRGDNRG
ncbi:hypothetical protein [Sphingomonas sp.]|uniref:hypothetical protein n=1 Tax=Sphingomonas sp. TaxID=28214 RepID=UPI001EB5544A|nr:hypothetical protein [Sphingomonas sp.]MBX3594445.1 hypothetical protein [Sphingomonas sp.]